jgi:hypothetical protein
MKTVLLAGLLALTPLASFAMGCSGSHDKMTMTCADGAAWDAEQNACMPIVTG